MQLRGKADEVLQQDEAPEPFPVTCEGDPSTHELIELLSR
jgi:hypothetical protein